MKTRNTIITTLLGFFCFINLNAQCSLACYADVQVSLDASGNATLTAEDVLASYGPACGTLVLEPSTFDCSDLGGPVPYTVTDLESGNSCSGNIHVKYIVGTMACYANVNIALPPSGTVTLTPELLLFDPPADCIPGAIINPPTLSCSDIGAPVFVTITDPVGGNSCWSHVNVSYAVGAMSCYADVAVALGPSGDLTLTPDMLLFDPPGACIPGAIITPSSVSCSDIGTPVFVTIADPVGGNSCWSNVTVKDPRPESCDIVVPAAISCGDAGVLFSVNVTGGYGPFDYDWQIKGNPKGWSIASGHGTDLISMNVGSGKIKLEVTITDVCGKKRKCSVKPECEDAPALQRKENHNLAASTVESAENILEIFPNPAVNQLTVNFGADAFTVGGMYLIDQLGRSQTSAQFGPIRSGAVKIDIQNLQPGIYWLVVEDKDLGTMIRKIVKL